MPKCLDNNFTFKFNNMSINYNFKNNRVKWIIENVHFAMLFIFCRTVSTNGSGIHLAKL